MKKNVIFLFCLVIVVFSSACGTAEIIMDPQALAGNPIDPANQAQAFVAGPTAAQMVITYDLIPTITGQLVYAPGSEMNLAVFRPDVVNQSLALVPIGATIALMDGFTPGPADVVASVYVGGKVAAVVLLTVTAAYEIDLVFDGIEDLKVNLEVGYLPTSDAHNPAHDVAENKEQAQAVLAALSAWTVAETGGNMGPGNDVRCLVLKTGETVLRFMVWTKTHTSIAGIDRGVILIWHAVAPEGVDRYVSTFSDSSANSLLKVPSDLRSDPNFSVSEWSCNQLPPAPPLPG